MGWQSKRKRAIRSSRVVALLAVGKACWTTTTNWRHLFSRTLQMSQVSTLRCKSLQQAVKRSAVHSRHKKKLKAMTTRTTKRIPMMTSPRKRKKRRRKRRKKKRRIKRIRKKRKRKRKRKKRRRRPTTTATRTRTMTATRKRRRKRRRRKRKRK